MKKKIWLLSGSGPEAWLYMCHRMHSYLQEKYGAVQDQDYVDYVLYNRPLTGFDETGIADYAMVVTDFKLAINELDAMGVSHIGIACNTLHLLLDQLDPVIQHKIVNMVDKTIQRCIQSETKKILLLWSYTSNINNLYAWYCQKYNLDYVKINTAEQNKIDMIIQNVMGARNTSADSVYLHNLIAWYKESDDIDAFVLGCTELPLAFTENNTGILYFNANDILVECLIDAYKAS